MNFIEITQNNNNLVIYGKNHILNNDFVEKVDQDSIHISIDNTQTIRLFSCKNTKINGLLANNAEELANLFGLSIL